MLEVTNKGHKRLTMLSIVKLQSCVLTSSAAQSSTLCNVNLLIGSRTQHTVWLDFAEASLQLGTQSKEQLEAKEAELQVCAKHACKQLQASWAHI